MPARLSTSGPPPLGSSTSSVPSAPAASSSVTADSFNRIDSFRFGSSSRAGLARAARAGPSSSSSTAASASTSGSTSRAGAAAAAAAAGAAGAADDIEMEPINGHRRRKSSLMNPSGASPHSLPGPSRPPPGKRVPPSQPQSAGLPDESNIPEEDDVVGRIGANVNDEQGRDSFTDDDLHDDEEMGLTDKDRKAREKKRNKVTLLDQRIVREKNISVDERKEADASVARRLMTNSLFILLWYFFSLSISVYNKWMFDQDNLNFAFPLFTTSMHMFVQFSLSALVLYFVPSLRPHQGHSSDQGRSRHESEPSNNGPLMTKMFYLTRIGPCGAATGLDIGLGNTSLKFISLTFYTMCKSSSLAFVLLFAFLFRLETPTWRLVAIIATMSLGVVLMVFGEVEFKIGGFVLVISAAFFSGFRWGLTQILLLRNPATSNPFSSIFFLTPVMFVTLFGLALPVEGFGPFVEGLRILSAEWGVVMTPLFLMFPGCIAFCMTASEFALLQRTSVVTLSIAGIFKEVLTISAASIVFKDELTLINVVGLLTTMVAIVAYNYVKIAQMRREAQVDVLDRQAQPEESSSSSNNTSDVDHDDAGEESTGLLRQSLEMSETIFTADGDIHHNLFSGPSQHVSHPHQYRSERED